MAQIEAMRERLVEINRPIKIDPMASDPKKVRAAKDRQADQLIEWSRDLSVLCESAQNVLHESITGFEADKADAFNAVSRARETAEDGLRQAGLSELVGGQIGADISGNRHAAARSFEYAINKSPVVTLAQRTESEIMHRIGAINDRLNRLSETQVVIQSELAAQLQDA